MTLRSTTSLTMMCLLPFLAHCTGTTTTDDTAPEDEPDPKVDIVFIMDNSTGMQAESEALALHLDAFIEQLTETDYQLAITTTDVASTFGALYSMNADKQILPKGTEDIADEFRKTLLCTATCFDAHSMPSNPTHECGDPIGEEVTYQYLDCLCGEDVWENNCGSGMEEGLEALFMSLCRATNNPPAECYVDNQFDEGHQGTNTGLIRDDSTVIPVIITDEGDSSRRLAVGEEDPVAYAELFPQFNTRMGFAVIGPQPDLCNNGGATAWGVGRYQWFANETNGLYLDIAQKDDADDCEVANFAVILERLSEWIR